MDKTTAGIIVDYDHYVESQYAQEFVDHRGHLASVILLVDEAPTDFELNELYDWNVVIVNNGKLPREQFLVAALSAMSNHSNVYPAIALAGDEFSDIYYEAGVLVVISD